MPAWISDDPSPFEDLPSDIAFRLWLDGLTPADVAHIRDPKPNTTEGRWLAAARARQKGTFDVRYDPAARADRRSG